MKKTYTFLTLLILVAAIFIYLTVTKSDSASQSKDQDTASLKVYSNPEHLSSSSPATVTNRQSPAPSSVFFASREANTSNVVGYIAYGAFAIYVPDWIVANWDIKNSNGGNVYTVAPRTTIADRDFSDIMIYISTSTEINNADTLYHELVGVDPNASLYGYLTAETILGKDGQTRIYHLEKEVGDKIFDRFFIDGLNHTAEVTFNADKVNYHAYGPKVREFVEGLVKGVGEQG